MVLAGRQVRRQIRRIHPDAKDRAVHLVPLASDASAAPDAVRLAADLPPLCPVAVHGSRQSASADATEPKTVQRRRELRLLDALRRRLAQNVEFPQPVAVPEPQSEPKLVSKMQPQVAQQETQDESEQPQEAHSEQVSR
jgi:hypothetical protein